MSNGKSEVAQLEHLIDTVDAQMRQYANTEKAVESYYSALRSLEERHHSLVGRYYHPERMKVDSRLGGLF